MSQLRLFAIALLIAGFLLSPVNIKVHGQSSAESLPALSISPGEIRIGSIEDSDSKLPYDTYRSDDWEIQPQKGERFRIWLYNYNDRGGEGVSLSVGSGRGAAFRESPDAASAYLGTGRASVKEITFPDVSKYTIRISNFFKGGPVPYKLFAESLGLPDDAARIPIDERNPLISDNEVSIFVRHTHRLHEQIHRVEVRVDYKKPQSIGSSGEMDRAVILAHVSCLPQKIQVLSIAGYRNSRLIGADRPPTDWGALSTDTRGGKIIEYVCKCQNWTPFWKQL
jgi:hypothetical protein